MTYNDFVKGMFGVTDLKKTAPTTLFMGTTDGKACSVTAYFHEQHGSYSDVDLDVAVAGQDGDYLANIQVQNNASIKATKTAGGYSFLFKDTTCGGFDTMDAKFSAPGFAARALTSVKTSVRENGCGASATFTTHASECQDLKPVVTMTSEVEAKIESLMKEAVGNETTEDADGNQVPLVGYINGQHEEGCELSLVNDSMGSLLCTWVIDDDMGNDSSPLKVAQIEVKDGKPVRVVKTWDSNKWDG